MLNWYKGLEGSDVAKLGETALLERLRVLKVFYLKQYEEMMKINFQGRSENLIEYF